MLEKSPRNVSFRLIFVPVRGHAGGLTCVVRCAARTPAIGVEHHAIDHAIGVEHHAISTHAPKQVCRKFSIETVCCDAIHVVA